MSTGKTYLKCKCPHCGAEVSYPDYAGGGASGCAKCGKTVLLPRAAAVPQSAPAKPVANPIPTPIAAPKPAPSAPPIKPPSAPAKRVDPSAIRPAEPKPTAGRSTFLRICLWSLNVAIVLAVVIVIGNHFKNRPPTAEAEAAPQPGPLPESTPAAPQPKQPSTPAPAAPAPVAAPPAALPAPAPGTPKGPKLLGDLKVTQVALDQPKGAKGSRLVYVTGVLKNDSDHQRFGVRVELDLLDATTNKVGTATDYRQMLEPRATWQFRALVTDRRTVGARFAGVKEDE